jgi:putative tricarboxylic transport membrane protein
MEPTDNSSGRPGRGLTVDRLSGAILILLGLFVVWERRVLPLGSAQYPGPGYFPLFLALLLVLFGAILLFPGRAAAPLRSISWSEATHALPLLGCCVLVTLFMERIGYRITMAFVLGVLFGILERMPLWLVLILTAGLSLGSFWLFDSLLRVPLPRGGWGF